MAQLVTVIKGLGTTTLYNNGFASGWVRLEEGKVEFSIGRNRRNIVLGGAKGMVVWGDSALIVLDSMHIYYVDLQGGGDWKEEHQLSPDGVIEDVGIYLESQVVIIVAGGWRLGISIASGKRGSLLFKLPKQNECLLL